MKIIEWNEKFSVGIKEIDDQHKVLVDILDELYTMPCSRPGETR